MDSVYKNLQEITTDPNKETVTQVGEMENRK